mgnify:CR=1 FL=1
MLWPLELDKAPNAKSMLFIDEITCVGCTFCTSVARNTFLMTSQVRESRSTISRETG